MAGTSNTQLILDILVGTNEATKELNQLAGLLKEFGISMAEVTKPSKNQIFEPTTASMIDGINTEINFMSSNLKSINELGKLFGKGMNVDKLTADMKKLALQTGITEKQFNKLFKDGVRHAKEFDFNMLTLMFTAMSLDRLFSGFNRSIVNSYTRAEEKNTRLSTSMVAISSSWEFFKFSVFDALGSLEIFGTTLPEMLVGIINTLNNLPDWAKLGLGLGSLLGSFLVKGLLVYAQAKMASNLITKALGNVLNPAAEQAGKAAAEKGHVAFVDKFKSLSATQKIAMGVGFTLGTVSIANMINSLKGKDYGAAVGYGIASALQIGGAIISSFNPAIGITLIVAGTVVMSISKYFTKWKNTLRRDSYIKRYYKKLGLDDYGNLDIDTKATILLDTSKQKILFAQEEIDATKEKVRLGEMDEKLGWKKIEQYKKIIKNYMDIGVTIDDNFATEIQYYSEIHSAMDTKIKKQKEYNDLKREELEITQQISEKSTLESQGWVFASDVTSSDLSKISSTTKDI